jgi:hypothetical protein
MKTWEGGGVITQDLMDAQKLNSQQNDKLHLQLDSQLEKDWRLMCN